MRMFKMKKATVGSPIIALLLLAGAGVSPLRAGYVDTSGIAYNELGRSVPYAIFLNPNIPGDYVGACCTSPPAVPAYQITDPTVVPVLLAPTYSVWDVSFDVEIFGTMTEEDLVYAVVTLGGPFVGNQYYPVLSVTGDGDWGLTSCPVNTPCLALSLDTTPYFNGTNYTDNLFDPVPEPSSYVLLATGLLVLVHRKRLADGIRQATRTQR
jgi:hypothetical protein